MEFILSTSGRSTAPFETWLKSLKELNDSLLINFDFAESTIKSIAYTNDKTTVKSSVISMEEAGFEIQSIKDDSGNIITQEEWASSGNAVLIRLAIYQQVARFISTVNTFTGSDNYTLTLTSQPVMTEKYGQQTYVTRAQFKSQALTMNVAGGELSEFYIISDDAFNNGISAVSNPMKFSVDPETIKRLLSVSNIYSLDVKKDVIDFCTSKEENGEWVLHAVDRNSHVYDFKIAYLQPGETEPQEITVPVNRNNFILGTKGDIDESVIVISADANPEKIRIDTGETTKTVIASVRV